MAADFYTDELVMPPKKNVSSASKVSRALLLKLTDRFNLKFHRELIVWRILARCPAIAEWSLLSSLRLTETVCLHERCQPR
ncbi:Uncharacterized protein APZ42_020941 [Daphnia magna]|uniref:Uncharacterized protein n=1 Tax=Daphnia magna TaxID=35525 RepID=A0A164X3E0_9CRUS|nr:Uncharacterized protein APZ42_020941 [Daphnia magna]